ncbi:hypothetical protein SPRG_01504 [Saprolegnia parasitica CBS 223.65]|uniref:EamA domain-containing protein n=1 Tax=Saprolegnia parasitica (strain CBS 223.65) TaxID=695850 RepID=A0A067CV30_SAPPC|nr:hypothetical protein SPRG_01504 [Saprolegnia parasitica CBS 223.65]KDO34368.1 hypothetical protein SPRG_01504 [Saprolegnia parasitica CBS 223.65]|eukprot:XP_012195104.1 hypothetical protein SPRG_01504 [Saprolegnia parasitica CBS 223.65]
MGSAADYEATIRALKKSLTDARNQQLRAETALARTQRDLAAAPLVDATTDTILREIAACAEELRAETQGSTAHALNKTIARLGALQLTVAAAQQRQHACVVAQEADVAHLRAAIEHQPRRKDYQMAQLEIQALSQENVRLRRELAAAHAPAAPPPVPVDTQRAIRRDKLLKQLRVQTSQKDDVITGDIVLDGHVVLDNVMRQKVGLLCIDMIIDISQRLDNPRVAELPRYVAQMAHKCATIPRLLTFANCVASALGAPAGSELPDLDALITDLHDPRAFGDVMKALNVTTLAAMVPAIMEMRSLLVTQREFAAALRQLLGLAHGATTKDILDVLTGQGVVVFTLGLLTGTGTTLMSKPIFQTWLMFAAMIFALPIQYIYHWHLERQWHANGGKITGFKRPQRVPIKTYFVLALPAAFDLIATYLANLGLLYVTVSVFQLMKCTVIIFVALLKVVVLKDHLRGYMWIGIAMNTAAAIMVGFTSFQDTDDQLNSTNNPGLGILMIVLSCFVQSAQYVFEEKLMGDGIDTAPPLIVVGMEGFWGLLFTSIFVYPIAYYLPGNDLGSYERFDDALTMLGHSKAAQIAAGIFVFVILGYNVFAVFVTFLLDSIWHAILDNFRPITVWGTDLLLFYVFTPGTFGEAWTIWSWLELGGMLTLLVGTAVYNGSIQLPGHYYDEPVDGESGATTMIRTPLSMASSALTRSPMISKQALKAADIARRTPDPMDRERVRKEYMTEFHKLQSGKDSSGSSASKRLDPAGHSYGSMDT